MPTIVAEDLRRFAKDLLHKGGFAEADAAQMADLLIWANLRGVDSHGVLRIPRYLEMLSLGMVNANHSIKTAHQFGAICVLDADKAPGAVAMNRAVLEASTIAGKFGMGWCSIRNTSHAGAIGYFVDQLANMGMIGIAITASKPLMTYYGAKGEALSSNPLAIGVPRADGGAPIILDMSTAAVALGKIMAAKDANKSIPIGWGVDAEGGDTTDPHEVTAVLPMAGAKGSGLSLMTEVLCSILAGNPSIAPALTGGKGGGFNGMVLAIDPRAFEDQTAILNDVRSLADAIHQLAPASGFDRVRLPGERGFETARNRKAHGVPVAAGTLKRLLESAASLGVTAPEALA
jgi:ureidoglycolate dehydrogenase (NAD+)